MRPAIDDSESPGRTVYQVGRPDPALCAVACLATASSWAGDGPRW
jgi:hypothetical protein